MLRHTNSPIIRVKKHIKTVDASFVVYRGGKMNKRKIENTIESISSEQTVPIDNRIGKRLRQQRTALKLSSEKLAKTIGTTIKQLNEFEQGTSPIGAGLLFQLSQVLEVPIQFFYTDVSDDDDLLAKELSNIVKNLDPTQLLEKPDTLNEVFELVQTYVKIEDPKSRLRLLELTQTFAGIHPFDGRPF